MIGFRCGRFPELSYGMIWVGPLALCVNVNCPFERNNFIWYFGTHRSIKVSW